MSAVVRCDGLLETDAGRVAPARLRMPRTRKPSGVVESRLASQIGLRPDKAPGDAGNDLHQQAHCGSLACIGLRLACIDGLDPLAPAPECVAAPP